MSSDKKKLLIANWKLNHSRASAAEFLATVLPSLKASSSVDLAIAPVAPMLDFVGQKLLGSPVALAAQNVFYEKAGAFTGEWSAEHLVDLSVKFCLVGHSERRQYFHESDAMVSKKALACFKANLMPVICVGENEGERVDGRSKAVIRRQVLEALALIPKPCSYELLFAYEPIWAIGTGRTASLEQLIEMHQLIKGLVSEALADDRNPVRILYGGSVNAQNISEIVSLPQVDGALVGGASLQASSFLSMVEQLHVA